MIVDMPIAVDITLQLLACTTHFFYNKVYYNYDERKKKI